MLRTIYTQNKAATMLRTIPIQNKTATTGFSRFYASGEAGCASGSVSAALAVVKKTWGPVGQPKFVVR